MNICYKITFFFTFFLSFSLFSQDIKIIELHDSITPEINQNDSEESEKEEIKDLLFNSDVESNIDKEKNIVENENSNEIIAKDENIIEQNNEDQSQIVSMPDYWEKSDKEDLEFLFNNLSTINSKVIASFFVEILGEFSKAPELYSQSEFDNLRIKTLVNMGHREKALRVLKNINTYDFYKNYYDSLKLEYYLSIKDLSEACSFKDSMQESLDNDNVLKVSIFCSFIQNNYAEADFLNSLLLDSQDKDEYFQKIYFNLKNNIDDPVDFTKLTFNESSFALYSAILRIGNLPFSEKFLEYDSINLSLPIILSPSTDISVRLKSAHKAYELGIFNAESLSALYQSADFTSKELNNTNKTIENYSLNPEMGMALLFQNARVQLLPITRLVSLREFWKYAVSYDLEKLAYAVSRNLIESVEPSSELSDYSIILARAHIFNKNFKQANKWISFAENYVSQSNVLSSEELNNVKFFYDLQKSEDNNTFIDILETNLIEQIEEKGIVAGYTETLKTIFASILNQKILIEKIADEKKVFDERTMPSSYIIDKIKSSSDTNNIGELILSALVSLNDKSWDDVHPQHLKILLDSFSYVNLDNLLKDLIIEIFEESKII